MHSSLVAPLAVTQRRNKAVGQLCRLIGAILTALGNAAQGTANSALSLARSELRDYYNLRTLSSYKSIAGLIQLALSAI